MEIKIKIPSFFAKYRIVKRDGKFLAQSKSAAGNWWSIDRDKISQTWTETYDMEYAAVETFEKAMDLINRSRVNIVWEGR